MPRDSQFDDQTVQPQIPLTHTKYDVEEARRGDFSAFSAEHQIISELDLSWRNLSSEKKYFLFLQNTNLKMYWPKQY